MNPYRFSPLGDPDPKSGKHIFFIGEMREVSAEWGFEIIDRSEKMPIQKMRYPDRVSAEGAHAKIIDMFKGIAPGIDGSIYDFSGGEDSRE